MRTNNFPSIFKVTNNFIVRHRNSEIELHKDEIYYLRDDNLTVCLFNLDDLEYVYYPISSSDIRENMSNIKPLKFHLVFDWHFSETDFLPSICLHKEWGYGVNLLIFSFLKWGINLYYVKED